MPLENEKKNSQPTRRGVLIPELRSTLKKIDFSFSRVFSSVKSFLGFRIDKRLTLIYNIFEEVCAVSAPRHADGISGLLCVIQ